MTGAPWEAEFRVEMPLAGRLIATQFPELAALPVRAFGEGWDNVAYLVGERSSSAFHGAPYPQS